MGSPQPRQSFLGGAARRGGEGSGGRSRTSATRPWWSAGSVGESGVSQDGMAGSAKADGSAALLVASAAGTSARAGRWSCSRSGSDGGLDMALSLWARVGDSLGDGTGLSSELSAASRSRARAKWETDRPPPSRPVLSSPPDVSSGLPRPSRCPSLAGRVGDGCSGPEGSHAWLLSPSRRGSAGRPRSQPGRFSARRGELAGLAACGLAAPGTGNRSSVESSGDGLNGSGGWDGRSGGTLGGGKLQGQARGQGGRGTYQRRRGHCEADLVP
ncbi:hypothetical protein VTN02DRAFT_1332 [Thermoascus thermophilus]